MYATVWVHCSTEKMKRKLLLATYGGAKILLKTVLSPHQAPVALTEVC